MKRLWTLMSVVLLMGLFVCPISEAKTSVPKTKSSEKPALFRTMEAIARGIRMTATSPVPTAITLTPVKFSIEVSF